MIVYTDTKKQFVEDVVDNRIHEKILEEIKRRGVGLMTLELCIRGTFNQRSSYPIHLSLCNITSHRHLPMFPQVIDFRSYTLSQNVDQI